LQSNSPVGHFFLPNQSLHVISFPVKANNCKSREKRKTSRRWTFKQSTAHLGTLNPHPLVVLHRPTLKLRLFDYSKRSQKLLYCLLFDSFLSENVLWRLRKKRAALETCHAFGRSWCGRNSNKSSRTPCQWVYRQTKIIIMPPLQSVCLRKQRDAREDRDD
jgi:hypothetical protein